uniref:Uncharacterized protein n=1 Tax=viral metagenome TaxID=1070528 RepID=A0A6C0LJM3_9ZZZZ
MSKCLNALITCNNGFHISVQASSNHFCTPQEDEGPYIAVEVCTFDVKIPNWPNPVCKYSEITGNPINATYYNVPSKALLELLEACGGIKNGTLPELN